MMEVPHPRKSETGAIVRHPAPFIAKFRWKSQKIVADKDNFACLAYWQEYCYCPTRHRHFLAYDREYSGVLGLVQPSCWFRKICYILPWSAHLKNILGLKSGICGRRFGCSVGRRSGVSASLPGASDVSLNFVIFPCFRLTASDFCQISHFAPIASNLEQAQYGDMELGLKQCYWTYPSQQLQFEKSEKVHDNNKSRQCSSST